MVLGVTVKYNSSETEKTSSDIQTLAETTLSTFNTNNLQKFDSVFRHSNLLKALDDTDPSILSSTATVKMKRSITPTLNADTKYTIKFNNPAFHPTANHSQTVVESSGFYLMGNTNLQYIEDDGNGVIRTFYLLGGTTKTITNASAGTVNYVTGEVVLTAFNITAVTNRRFKLTNALADVGSWNGTTPAIGAIYVASTQRRLEIPFMPAGSRVVLYVNGGKRILGKGGNGGNGSNNHSAGGNGQNGQSALWVRTATTIVNSGQIASGGGGGGGGRGGQCVYQNTGQKSCMKGNQCPVTYQNFSKERGGGGGGGAGYPGGQGGNGDANGQNGQSNARGNGGQNQSCNAQRGRHGGNLGQNAQGGGTAGSPGSRGNAVDGVSYITYETKGTVNGPEVN